VSEAESIPDRTSSGFLHHRVELPEKGGGKESLHHFRAGWRREQRDRYKEEEDGVNGVTVSERGVRKIEGDWENQGERGEGEEIRRAQQEEANETEEHEREGESVPSEKKPSKQGIGSEEILPGGFGTEPGGNEPATTELQVECRI
jgi:hypothetical protein